MRRKRCTRSDVVGANLGDGKRCPVLGGKSHLTLGTSRKRGAKETKGRSRCFEQRGVEGRDDVSQIFPWCFRRTTIVCRSFGCAVAIFLWNGSAVLLGERGDKGSWRTLSQLSALGEMTLHRLVVGDGRWIAWWTRGVVGILPHGEKAGEERSLAGEAGGNDGDCELEIGDWRIKPASPRGALNLSAVQRGGRHLEGGDKRRGL